MSTVAELKHTPRTFARTLLDQFLTQGFEPYRLHEWKDAGGRVLFWVAGCKHPDGRKEIRPFHATEEGFRAGKPEKPAEGWPLYGIASLRAHSDGAVFVVEGEPCADALHKLGLPAVTSGGAASCNSADWRPLAGRECVVWPDNDDAGRKYAADVAGALASLGCALRVLDVDALGLAPKSDAVDWLREHAGATAADVLALPKLERGAYGVTKATEAPSVTFGTGYPACFDGEPVPLPALPSVRPYAHALLPSPLADYTQDAAERTGCPPEFVAVALLVSAGAILGRRIGIRPKRHDSWQEVPLLWGACVGLPSSKKSPGMTAGLAFIRELDRRHGEAFAAARLQHEASKAAAEARKAEAKKACGTAEKKAPGTGQAAYLAALGEEPEAPTRRRLITNDATYEAMSELLGANPHGLLCYRDELTGWLALLERQGQEGARAFWLECWNGKGAFHSARIGRGELDLPAAAACVLGSIQPGPLGELVAGAAVTGGDGLLQRFGLLVWPEASGLSDVDRAPDSRAYAAVLDRFERLDALDPLSAGAQAEGGEVPFLRFDAEAQEGFNAWREENAAAVLAAQDEAPALATHLAKYPALLARLALVHHLCEQPEGRAVGLAAFERAAEWCEFLESHARRVYALARGSRFAAARALAGRIEKAALPGTFTARDVYRKNWHLLDEPDTVAGALETLTEYGWVLAERVPTSGRTAEHWHLHASLPRAAP